MSRPGGKAGVGLLSLKWNNYKSIFFESINTLRDQSKYTDATLAVEGHFYHVHKLVMSTCSEYFSNIFEKTPCKAPVIVLKDVTRDEIEGLLSYMYLGEVNVHQQDIASFLKTAESLKIKGLAVSDEEPTNLSKSQSSSRKDASRDSPSVKKRRMENNGSSTAVPPVKAFKKSDNPLINMKVEMNSPEISKTKLNKPPMVKIGMSDAEERDRRIRTNINYEEDPGSDTQDTGDVYGPDSPMTDQAPEPESPEHETENEPSTSFFGGALQQSGDAQWEGEDAGSSFIPETYMGNVSTSLKAQGPVSEYMSKSEWGQILHLEKAPKSTTKKKSMKKYDGVNVDKAEIVVQLRELLSESPNLSSANFKTVRAFFASMMKFINRGSRNVGYGNPEKMPTWWPLTVPWATSGEHSMDSNDYRLIVRSAYLYYGINVHVGGAAASEIQTVGDIDAQDGEETETLTSDNNDDVSAHSTLCPQIDFEVSEHMSKSEWCQNLNLDIAPKSSTKRKRIRRKNDGVKVDNAEIIVQLRELLSESPNLSSANFKTFRTFLTSMMKVIIGSRNVGYGNAERLPAWWPSTVPWAKSGVHTIDNSDQRLIVRTAYQYYGINVHGGGAAIDIQTVGDIVAQHGDETEIQTGNIDAIPAHSTESSKLS